MREKKPEDPPEDIPFWFVTYSDVITLLMTFFILLLTFATNEPEMFERMQVSMFGGGGATGLAGPNQGPLEKDAIVMRHRPKAGRMTVRGSETPAIDADPTYRSLAAGIAGLENADQLDPADSHSVVVPLSMLIDAQGQITSLGEQRMRMFARQLKKAPYELSLQAGVQKDLGHALTLARYLTQSAGVLPGKIGIGSADPAQSQDGRMRITLTRQNGR